MFELPPNFYCSLTASAAYILCKLNCEKHKQFYVSIYGPFNTGIKYDTRGENGLTQC